MSFASDGSAVSSASSLSGELLCSLIHLLIYCDHDYHGDFDENVYENIYEANSDFWPGESGERRSSPFGQVNLYQFLGRLQFVLPGTNVVCTARYIYIIF